MTPGMVAKFARPVLLLAVAVAALAAIAGGAAASRAPYADPAGRMSDRALYRHVAQAVRGGGAYHETAITQQRAWNYPVRPFVTVRMPILAWFHAALGDFGLRLVAVVAAAALAPFWLWRLAAAGFAVRLAGTGAVAACALPLALSPLIYFHDFWAGLALAFAIGLRSATARAALGTLAALVRELTAPFLAIEAGARLMRRDGRRSAAPALAGLALVAAALAAHAAVVLSLTTDADLASAGWSAMRGPGAVVADVGGLTALQFLPYPLTAALVFLPLLGWFEFDDKRTAFVWFAVFLGAIAVLARADNNYWAANLLPAYFIGLAFVPSFFRAWWTDRTAAGTKGQSSAQPAR